MKIQLQGQSLRLRIDEAELARLQAGESIENLTRLPGGCALRQQLQLVDAATPTLQLLEDGFGFGLPADALADYVARLPCRDGLVFLSRDDSGQVWVGGDVSACIRGTVTL